MEPRVWIAEELDEDDSFMLTGRFSCHLDTGDRVAEECEDLLADEAIAWGRARAAVVLIRTGESGYHSAGDRNPDPAEFPPWPPDDLRLARRRVNGFEALDNTDSDPPVLWDVRAKVHLDGADPRPFYEQIRAERAALNVQVPAPGYPPLSASFIVEASTPSQAQRLAQEVLERAQSALLESLPADAGAFSFSSGVEVYPHRPGRAVTGPGVTY